MLLGFFPKCNLWIFFKVTKHSGVVVKMFRVNLMKERRGFPAETLN